MTQRKLTSNTSELETDNLYEVTVKLRQIVSSLKLG